MTLMEVSQPTEQQMQERKRMLEEMGSATVSSDILVMMLQRFHLSQNLEHQLKGEIFNPATKEWDTKGKPLLNDEGIKWVETYLTQYISIDKIVTALTDEEVSRIARDARLNVVNKFYVCYKDFDIQKSDLSPLVDIIDHFVFSNLTSSRDATLLEFMKPTYHREETFKPIEPKHWYSGIIHPFGGK